MKNFVVLLAFAALAAQLGTEPLVIHEWGTFTVLQDENGSAVSGINTDDEPVPDFVHRAVNLIRPSLPAQLMSKGIPACHPDVIMRMETPVVYFYPPGGKAVTLDLAVEFTGGWMTEFYPEAAVSTPGVETRRLQPEARGRLEWKGLSVGGNAPGPQTDSPVWLAPREVDAASVTTSNGETERYLFYRGVANLEVPLRVVREGPDLRIEGPTAATRAWLVDVRPGGMGAFREVKDARTAAEFSPSDYGRENIGHLRTQMRTSLIAEGLFPREADAMLATWDRSYFRNPGLRFFYLVPPAWTDAHLPMQVSVPAQLTRVMVGRIEIVTPYQRHLLDLLATGTAPINPADPPAAYYLLGRFADALVLNELRHRPNDRLRDFAGALGLGLP